MGDKRKIRTPKVRESFFKPMNLLGLNGNSINALTYSTITYCEETKSNLERHKLKILLQKSMAMVKGFQKTSENLPDTFSSIMAKRMTKNIHLKM